MRDANEILNNWLDAIDEIATKEQGRHLEQELRIPKTLEESLQLSMDRLVTSVRVQLLSDIADLARKNSGQ